MSVKEQKRRIFVRWNRGLTYRLDWTTLLFFLQYSDTAEPEGVA